MIKFQWMRTIWISTGPNIIGCSLRARNIYLSIILTISPKISQASVSWWWKNNKSIFHIKKDDCENTFLMSLRVEVGQSRVYWVTIRIVEWRLIVSDSTSDVFNIFSACHSAFMFFCFYEMLENNQFWLNKQAENNRKGFSFTIDLFLMIGKQRLLGLGSVWLFTPLVQLITSVFMQILCKSNFVSYEFSNFFGRIFSIHTPPPYPAINIISSASCSNNWRWWWWKIYQMILLSRAIFLNFLSCESNLRFAWRH